MFGMLVVLIDYWGNVTFFHNVTEVHYNFNSVLENEPLRTAFESDIHSTGIVVNTSSIKSMEVRVESKKAQSFG